jgi:hypothetical protein
VQEKKFTPNDLIYLAACSLLTDAVRRDGFDVDEEKVTKAIDLAVKVWKRFHPSALKKP